MLHIQSALRSGKTVADICEPLGIKYTQKDGKCIFTYSQIDSPKTDSTVRECRGLILYTDNWDIACYPFERFFNYGESGADILPDDLSGCLVLPKLDGSMVSLWFDRTDQAWKVSTRSMMYAEGQVGDFEVAQKPYAFANLFWDATEETNIPTLVDSDSNDLWKQYTYVFELTSPLNRIVTPYQERKITLLTARSIISLDEMSSIARGMCAFSLNVDTLNPVPITNWQELLKMEGLAATDEGFVVVKESKEGSHKRVKVKNPSYLAISRLVSSVSEKAFLELIQRGGQDEYLVYYSEYKDNIDKLLMGLRRLETIVRQDYIDLDPIKDRKAFALEAVKRKFPSMLFAMRDNKITNLAIDLLLLQPTKLLNMIHIAQGVD